ncbi:DUF2973 domain-containing protein [Myxosarcina sp. GI1(2024)]
MLHLLYILAFTFIALLAVSNLIRSLITISMNASKVHPGNSPTSRFKRNSFEDQQHSSLRQIHPELLDERGKVIEEPLLVMRSVSVEDARQKLDALYDSSPSKTNNDSEE